MAEAPLQEFMWDDQKNMVEVWWAYFNEATATASTLSSSVPLNTLHRLSDGNSHSEVVLNTTHRTSNGSDHGFIDQDVTISSRPEFNGKDIIKWAVLQG